MARRQPRQGGQSRPRRRAAVFSLAALAVAGAALWIAPAVLVHTSLRDRPLVTALAGIDGGITSRSARWGWLSGIEYRDVVLHDRAGRPAVLVPLVMLDRGLLQLALDPTDLGTLRLVSPQAMVVVHRGGSSLEDMLAPWLAGQQSSTGVSCDLEIVDGIVQFAHASGGDAWRVTDLIAAGAVESATGLGSWTVAGRVRHAGPPASEEDVGGSRPPEPAVATADRLDRSTIPAAAAAVVVRDGGFSVSSPAADQTGARTVTLAARRLPLGGSGIVAARCGFDHLLDGLADVRLDCDVGTAGRRLRGTVSVERFAVCRADTLAERFAIERCEVPLDLELGDESIVVRRFAAESPAFRAEATGRIGLPRRGVWQWAESLVGEDFALAVDVDLAAASRALPGGLVVRPDVRVSGGRLQVAASSRADGPDRVLEVRAAARDLAAVQRVAGANAAVEERPLRWTEPFSAWLRGRRAPAHGFVIEESRIASPSLELSAAGDATTLAMQWAVDVGGLTAEVAELLDTGGLAARGTSRGRIDVALGTPTTVKASASATGLELAVPGRPPWRDEEITLEVEGLGGVAAGAVAIDRGRITVKAADDMLEGRVEGGVLVDVAGLLLAGAGRPDVPCIRPAAEPDAVLAEWVLGGDVARWQARLGSLAPAFLPAGVEVAGRVEAALAAKPRGDAWQLTRAGVEIEKFTVSCGGRRVTEPRVVATAAAMVHPATGQIDVSSAEILSATLSVRSGGVSWMPAGPAAAPGNYAILDRLRGRVQWQADVGRLEPWLLSAAAAARWPATGRAWGTIDLVDGPGGASVLVEATGSQIGISAAAAAGTAARPVWTEPRAVVALEVTRPSAAAGPADRLRIDRLAIESSTLAVAARGSVEEWTTRGLVVLDGTVAYDWAQVSRLLVPSTGGRVRLTGAGGRPFRFRGPLGRPAPAAATPGPPPAAVPLPDDWLTASRGGGGTEAVRVALPVAQGPVRDRRVAALRDISIDTSAAWTAADIDGVSVAGGEAAVRLFEGQLAIGPIDVAAAGGRLRGAPWIRFEPWPGELIVPPGRVVERVALSGSMCDQVTTWLSPLLGHSTHTSGALSVDLAGARLPLGDPAAGELTGQVVFDALEVTPSAALAPLANLLVRLQSLVDPRVALGDRTVLLRVRPDPVRVRLASRRLWHEGLVMDAGQFTVTSAGSVGDDGTLAMEVEVALRGDLVGSTPILAQLVRTPLVIPLTGTVKRPHFDARAIDQMVARIVENTAQAVITDGIGRGLEAILGGPRPSPVP